MGKQMKALTNTNCHLCDVNDHLCKLVHKHGVDSGGGGVAIAVNNFLLIFLLALAKHFNKTGLNKMIKLKKNKTKYFQLDQSSLYVFI